MNYWPRWIGSIQKKTSHLSLAEMGAYDRLLDHCYATEAPLPADVDRCCRIAGAASKAERAAVASVLAEFFTLTEAGYSNERVTSELLIAKPKIDAARTNGAKGGRPKKIPAETQRVSSGNPSGTQSESSTSSEVIPSVPNGTGAAAPPPTDRDAVFANGVTLLTAAGISDKNARSFLAMQCKEHGETAVRRALERCAVEQPIQPVPWLQALLRSTRQAAATSKPDRIAQANIAVVRSFAERTAT